jgi:N-dimethylarginine dimethylaminohydrolase
MELVVCNPAYFQIEYVINPWMKRNFKTKVDKFLAKKQWDGMCQAFVDNGIELFKMQPVPTLPDMVFTANQGMFIKDTYVSANFRYQQRKEEVIWTAWELFNAKKVDKYEQCPFHWEGQAELFKVDNKNYIGGYGYRGTLMAIDWLVRRFDIDIHPMRVVSPDYYHLDVCLTIRDGKVFVYEDAFAKNDLENLKGSFEVVPVSKGFAYSFGLNCIHKGKKWITSRLDISKKEKDEFEGSFGLQLLELDMSEFIKSGGGVFCCTMRSKE